MTPSSCSSDAPLSLSTPATSFSPSQHLLPHSVLCPTLHESRRAWPGCLPQCSNPSTQKGPKHSRCPVSGHGASVGHSGVKRPEVSRPAALTISPLSTPAMVSTICVPCDLCPVWLNPLQTAAQPTPLNHLMGPPYRADRQQAPAPRGQQLTQSGAAAESGSLGLEPRLLGAGSCPLSHSSGLVCCLLPDSPS